MSWSTVKLSKVADIAAGQGAPQGADDFSNEGIPFIRAGHLSDLILGMSENELPKVTEDVANKYRLKLYPQGTVLFAKSGMSCMKGHIYQLKNNAYVVNHLACVIPNDIDGNFLKYYFYVTPPNALIKDEAYPSIRLSDIGNLEIPRPTPEVQRQIADALDKAQSLIATRREQIAVLDKLAKDLFVDMFGDPKENPLNWDRKTIKDVCKKVTDGTHQSPQFTASGIPFLFVSNIRNGLIDYNTQKFISEQEYNELIKRTPIEIGDILYTIVGSYGNPAVVRSLEPKFCFQRHIAYLKPDTQIVEPDYLATAMLTSDFKEQLEIRVKGIAQKTLNLSELKAMELCVPPLEKQSVYTNRVSAINLQKARLTASLAELETLYQSLTERAFTGELFG